jgi:hypothetical protein
MPDYLQPQFEKFHEAIKLYDNVENQELREKRDILTDELREYFDKKSKEEGTPKITFSVENQGSYSMSTGIRALNNCDFDIDVMVLFNISIEDYDPVEVKNWVYDALNKKNRTVEYKKPCVRVQYFKDGEPSYHVDLPLYSASNIDNQFYLSIGKPTSYISEKVWEIADPKLLKQKINSWGSNADDRLQMKRIIRYLKRWKDYKFSNTKNGKPHGIAITALAFNLFQPNIERNQFDSSIKPKDLLALKNLVNSVLSNFDPFTQRITVKLPVRPYNDLFKKMTDNQQVNFKNQLETLKDALIKAEAEVDPHEASKILRAVFGEDFPLIEKNESGQKRILAFPGKSESA